MEGLAREAAVAKATLYAQFRNKEEVFLAVCGRMARANSRTFLEALTATDGTLDARVVNALVAKHRRVHVLVRSSPHAADLLDHTAQLAGDLFTDSDRSMLDHLAAELATDARLAPLADRVARALFFGALGLAGQLTTVAQLEAELEAFVLSLLAGSRTQIRVGLGQGVYMPDI